jgi:hypothetical protein
MDGARMMRPAILFGAVALLLLSAPVEPASAQHVIPNPGRCAQHFPNANCQNYGYGNPYTSYGWRRAGHRHYYSGYRHHRRHRH